MEEVTCLECGSVIHGRTDKKFCNDFCRNSYHNRKKSRTNSSLRAINRILKKNYLILKEKVPEDKGKIMISKKELLSTGFNMTYHTHTYITRRKQIYTYCYDYGFLELDEDRILLVKRDDKKAKD